MVKKQNKNNTFDSEALKLCSWPRQVPSPMPEVLKTIRDICWDGLYLENKKL